NDDSPKSFWELTQRALERVNVAQQVHTKAIMEQARFVEYHKYKSNSAMNDAALDRMRQLKMQAVTTEDDLKQAKTLHQRLNQAYRDQLTQDEQESEEDYSESRIKTNIPVLEDIKTIDFSSVGRKDFPGTPVFELDSTFTGRDSRLLEVVKTVVDFLQVFERYYRQAIIFLFDDLASRYMLDALKSSELTERYEQALTRPGYQDSNWENIQACVCSIFKLNELQTDLRSKLFAIRPNHQESIYDYTQRIKILEKLISEYTEDLQVLSINALIDYMNRNPTVLFGDRSDPLNWIIKSYNKKRSGNSEKPHASQGSTGGSSNNKNVFSGHMTSKPPESSRPTPPLFQGNNTHPWNMPVEH
ncbi:hypothetical protein BGZ80_011513, partial [Entomortierella chlamydospora]